MKHIKLKTVKSQKGNMAANQISTESIGPDQASALLAGNLNNRDLSQSFVNKYAADMESGKWASNASMIRIDTNGHLQDGQHRLAAIKQSGTTQDFVVVKDCPVEDFKKLDLGRGRSARDALTVLGYKKPKVLSGGIRLHYLYKSGRLTESSVFAVTNDNKNGIGNRTTQLSKSETIEYAINYAKKHPMVSPLVERASSIQKGFRIVPVTVFLAFLLEANELGDTTLEFATDFLKEFADCKSTPGTATHSLFVKMVQQSKTGMHYSQANRLAHFIVAWNAWIKGKPRIHIKVKGAVPKMVKADA